MEAAEAMEVEERAETLEYEAESDGEFGAPREESESEEPDEEYEETDPSYRPDKVVMEEELDLTPMPWFVPSDGGLRNLTRPGACSRKRATHSRPFRSSCW